MSHHRGCYWHEHQQRWRVTFRVNGKLKQFGQYKTLQEAQTRADEIWPTLPIAQRSMKKCDVCGVTKSTSKDFRYLWQTCKICCLKKRKDTWWIWTRGTTYGCNKMRVGKQRHNIKGSWHAWVRMKQIVLCNRRNKSSVSQQKRLCLTTWGQWCVYELQRFARETHDQEMDEWELKIKRWATQLRYRKNKRFPEQN